MSAQVRRQSGRAVILECQLRFEDAEMLPRRGRFVASPRVNPHTDSLHTRIQLEDSLRMEQQNHSIRCPIAFELD